MCIVVKYTNVSYLRNYVKRLVAIYKWCLVYLNILTQSITITDSMFNFGKFLTKNVITFDLTEIERKTRYLIGMKFCCASNAGIKNVKIARKKQTLKKYIFNKTAIFPKRVQIFRRKKDIFSDSGGSSCHFDYLFTCLGRIVKL